MDTGADKTLISKELFDKISEKQVIKESISAVKLQGVTGHELKVLSEVSLKTKIGRKNLQHKFHVVQDLPYPVLLGLDFLSDHKIKLDYETHTLSINSHQLLLLDENGKQPDLRLGFTRSKGFVEPHSISLVKIKTKGNLKGNCLVEPLANSYLFYDQPGLSSPRAIVKDSKNLIVPIFNETSQRITIKKGHPIAVIEQIKTSTILYPSTTHVNTEQINADANVAINSITQLGDKPIKLETSIEQQFNKLMNEKKHVFAQSDSDLGQTHLAEAKLNTGESKPIKQRPYRLPYAQWPMLEKQINDLLKAGIITQSESPWASPILFVPKKDSTQPRMCVDYRKLNKVLVPNSYPLPNIQDILASMQGARCYSVLDLKSGFHQIPIRKEDQEKTAFVVGGNLGSYNLYHYKFLPFGLHIGPGLFQSVMTKALGPDVLNKFVACFIDDLCIYSKTPEEHLKHLTIIFEKLENAGLKLKMSKCSFFQSEVKYLGHVISGEGILPDQEKVSAIRKLQAPTTVKEVRSFVGMASYYRNFIKDFSELVQPITELTKKNKRFEWTSEHQKSFEALKNKLSEAPVLAHPQIGQPYILYTDASNYAIGAVLTQENNSEEHVIQYLSKQLSGSQLNWPIIEIECYSIVFA